VYSCRRHVTGRRCLDTGIRSGRLDLRGHCRLFRQGLTVTQVALALVLAVAAGLLVRTMRALGAVDLGFDPNNIIIVGASTDHRHMFVSVSTATSAHGSKGAHGVSSLGRVWLLSDRCSAAH
jgi:hypothetical protein